MLSSPRLHPRDVPPGNYSRVLGVIEMGGLSSLLTPTRSLLGFPLKPVPMETAMSWGRGQAQQVQVGMGRPGAFTEIPGPRLLVSEDRKERLYGAGLQKAGGTYLPILSTSGYPQKLSSLRAGSSFCPFIFVLFLFIWGGKPICSGITPGGFRELL